MKGRCGCSEEGRRWEPLFISAAGLPVRTALAYFRRAAVGPSSILAGGDMPLRYNNDKRKKPLFSSGLNVCRHLFNSFSKLKHGEKNIEKRRLFH